MEAGEVTERGQVSAPAALWGHWDFMLLWGGQSISELGSGVTQLALPLTAVLVLKASAFQVGLLTAATYASFALIALPAGAIVDRIAKRRLLVVCDAARMLIIGSVPVAGRDGTANGRKDFATGHVDKLRDGQMETRLNIAHVLGDVAGESRLGRLVIAFCTREPRQRVTEQHFVEIRKRRETMVGSVKKRARRIHPGLPRNEQFVRQRPLDMKMRFRLGQRLDKAKEVLCHWSLACPPKPWRRRIICIS